MKTRLWKIIFVILVLLPVCANATTMDFYNDGTITDGNNFGTVNIWDDANVTMTGGKVFWCYTYNTSSFVYYSDYGDLSFISMYDNSLARNYANWTPTMELYNNSQMHIYNGHIGSSVWIYGDAELHIHGHNLEYISGVCDVVFGQWPDGRSFDFAIRNSFHGTLRDNVFLHETPEPSTLSLLGLFTLFIRKRGDCFSLGNKQL